MRSRNLWRLRVAVRPRKRTLKTTSDHKSALNERCTTAHRA
jgi:hypothetical protein